MSKKYLQLRHINNLLVACIVVVNCYVIILPVLPAIQFKLHKKATQKVSGLPYKTVQDSNPEVQALRKELPKDNRIVIGSIALDEHIFEGKDPNLVHKGVWARPLSSTPEKGGNTVLVGHRFTYNGPATFYNLDKVKTSDKISIYWQEKEIVYTVTETKIVPATALEIESPTQNAQLTIYTCTPLWSAKDRLVIIATKDEATP